MTSGSLFKTENSRIASESLNLQTVTSTKTSLSAFDDKRYTLDDGQQTLLYGNKNILGQTAIGIDDGDDNAVAEISNRTDDDDLEKECHFLKMVNSQCLECEDFLDGVSEEFPNTQNIDWDDPENDDDYSEDSFADENTQPHRSLRQLMDQVNSS